jgi:hypothetical protein
MHTTLRGRPGRGQDCDDHTHPNGDDMVSAADYPFVDVLWMTIAFFFWIAWIWPRILVFPHRFPRHALRWSKTEIDRGA